MTFNFDKDLNEILPIPKTGKRNVNFFYLKSPLGGYMPSYWTIKK